MQSNSDQLSLIFLALSHPVRRALLDQLVIKKSSVSELTESLDIKGPMMTKHLKMLEKAGLIERDKVVHQKFSQLKVDAFRDVNNWLEKYRELFRERFDRLENYYMENVKDKENSEL